MEWDIYKEGMIMRAIIILTRHDPFILTSHDLSALRLMTLREYTSGSHGYSLDLLSLLFYTQTLNSTIKLDKVYGVFGLTTSDLGRMGLQPEYRKPVQELYTDVATALLATTNNVDILSVARPDLDGHDNFHLPSWVPDWSFSADYPRSLVFQKMAGGPQYLHPPFNASNSSLYSYRPLVNYSQQCLLLSGCCVDRISDLTMAVQTGVSPLDLTLSNIVAISNGTQTRSQNFWLGGGLNYAVKNLMDRMNERRQKKELNAFVSAKSVEFDTYAPTGEPILLAFMRTLSAGYVPRDEEAITSAFKAWLKTTSGIRHDIRAELREIGLPLPGLVVSQLRFQSLIGMVVGRRLMWTENDYLGLAPAGAQQGDHVVLLKGGRVPFILRKAGNCSYRVIGESYVHGIMYGEAFDSQKCSDITLV